MQQESLPTRLEEAILAVLSRQRPGTSTTRDVVNRINTLRLCHTAGVQVALVRMESNGLVKSSLLPPLTKRGGRRQKDFRVTPAGKKALAAAQRFSAAVARECVE